METMAKALMYFVCITGVCAAVSLVVVFFSEEVEPLKEEQSEVRDSGEENPDRTEEQTALERIKEGKKDTGDTEELEQKIGKLASLLILIVLLLPAMIMVVWYFWGEFKENREWNKRVKERMKQREEEEACPGFQSCQYINKALTKLEYVQKTIKNNLTGDIDKSSPWFKENQPEPDDLKYVLGMITEISEKLLYMKKTYQQNRDRYKIVMYKYSNIFNTIHETIGQALQRDVWMAKEVYVTIQDALQYPYEEMYSGNEVKEVVAKIEEEIKMQEDLKKLYSKKGEI